MMRIHFITLTLLLCGLTTGSAVLGGHFIHDEHDTIKLLSAEGSGWLMPGEVFEFYSKDGSRMVIEAEDISYDDIPEDEINLEVTDKGFTLHVSANL